MRLKKSNITILDVGSCPPKGFRTAVSLHSHTLHSKEGLAFVPRYASRIPIICFFFDRESDRYFRLNGKRMDFERWYWTPPVAANTVFKSESERIQSQLGLKPLVSVTDHDDISTAMVLRLLDPSCSVPISLEWTLPISGTAIHIGIHNLPPDLSTSVMGEIARYKSGPNSARFAELLAWLNEYPGILMVLNHPLSDLNSVGSERLKAILTEFLSHHRAGIHALEINGYRPWRENHAAFALAEQYKLTVISGGDRHGCSPNAVLNLTNAATFSEFVSEIRNDKASEVLLMPEYQESLYARKLESVADFFRYRPDNPVGQQRWTDRVFIRFEGGLVQPLSTYWHRTVPLWVKSAMWFVCLLGNRNIQPALHMALARKLGVAFLARMHPRNP